MKTENEARIQSEVSEEIAFTRIHIFAIYLRYLQAEDHNNMFFFTGTVRRKALAFENRE